MLVEMSKNANLSVLSPGRREDCFVRSDAEGKFERGLADSSPFQP